MSDSLSLKVARPFLKWAGGKGQLLSQLEGFFPPGLRDGSIRRYVEPFVGSGALFFRVRQVYPIQEFVLADVNPELILAYKTVQHDVDSLIAALSELQEVYVPLAEVERRDFYYHIRQQYNQGGGQVNLGEFQPGWVSRSAQMLFLNRTCYNGLFRLNAAGAFNVPFGRYANPRVLDADNLRAVSRLLQGISINCNDFTAIESQVDATSFVYFDPPYRPISKTAHFTAYSRHNFDDAEQLRLAAFYRRLDGLGARLMLSNSDPRNQDARDDFFERVYAGYRIERVQAGRNINSQAQRRGPIAELVILNY
jgi:DNA adenine methylase